MAAHTYTRRFVHLQIPTLERAASWIVPDGFTWILRDIIVYNGDGAAGRIFYLALNDPGTLNAFLYAAALPAWSTQHLDVRQELLPGETVTFSSNAAGFASALLTGYRFDLV